MPSSQIGYSIKAIDSPKIDGASAVVTLPENDKEKQRIAIETAAKQEQIRRQEAELKQKEEELKQIEKQLKEERFRLIIDKTSNAIFNEIINKHINEELTQSANNELKSYKQIISVAEKIFNDIIIDSVNEFVDDMLRAEIKNQTKEYLMYEYFWRWRINARGRIEKRQQMERLERTPIWLPDNVSSSHISQLAHPSQHSTICMRKRYRQGTANPISIPVQKDRQIDVFDIVHQYNVLNQLSVSLAKSSYLLTTPSTYWKCIISLPDQKEDAEFYQRYDKWLNGIFKRRFTGDLNYFFCEQLYGFKGDRQSIAISMRKCIGTQLINESGRKTTSKDTAGANGILFLFSMASNLEFSQQRLKSILEITSSSNAAMAIVVYNNNHDKIQLFDREHFFDKLKINHLANKSEIDYFHCDEQVNSKQLTDLIETSIKFIASEHKFESHLQQQSAVSFLNQCLSDQFWKRITTSSQVNPALHKAVTNPNFVIHLYNNAVNRLINICQTNIDDHPEFPHEFKQFIQATNIDVPRSWEHFPNDWKLLRRQKQWKTFFNELKLSTMNCSNLDNFDSIQENILLFCQQNISDEKTADLITCQAIACCIKHLQSFNVDDELTQIDKMQQFSWIPIIQLVAIESLTLHYKEACNEKRLPNEIIYNRQELMDYTLTPWWLQQNGLLKNVRVQTEYESITDIDDSANNSVMIIKKPRIQRIDDNELFEILQRCEKSTENADRFIANSKAMYDESKIISKNFDRMLYEEERDIRVKKLEWQMSMRKEDE